MKKYIAIIGFSMLFFAVYSQNNTSNGSKKLKKVTSATYSGHWKGAEKCQGVSSPLSLITIISGPSAVFISGIYSTQGRIKGTIKDGILIIPLQEVNDPNFVNLALEGVVTLSDDHQSLLARIKVHNNNTQDECTAVYKKQ